MSARDTSVWECVVCGSCVLQHTASFTCLNTLFRCGCGSCCVHQAALELMAHQDLPAPRVMQVVLAQLGPKAPRVTQVRDEERYLCSHTHIVCVRCCIQDLLKPHRSCMSNKVAPKILACTHLAAHSLLTGASLTAPSTQQGPRGIKALQESQVRYAAVLQASQHSGTQHNTECQVTWQDLHSAHS